MDVDIELFWIEDTNSVLIGFHEKYLRMNDDQYSACTFNVKNWLTDRGISTGDIEDISITNKNNFRKIVEAIKKQSDLWDEFVEWKLKQTQRTELAEVVNLKKDHTDGKEME